jgi:hypothetical protein
MNFIGTPRYLNSAESLVRLISSAVWLFPGFILIVYQVHINASLTSVTALIHPEVFGNDIWRPCILSLKSEKLDIGLLQEILLKKGGVGMLFRKIDYTTWTLAKGCCVPNQALFALSEAPCALISVGWELRLFDLSIASYRIS